MRKLALAVLFVALVGSLAMAQSGTITGNTSYIPTTDVMGAHENGGRGCAGCHAPHSGGRGSGGVITGAGSGGTGNMGDTGLWGTDTTYIQNGGTITFDGSYTVNLSGLTWASSPMYKGVATCLSCHDGNVSKGAMMSGIAYEQAWGLLNFASGALRNSGPNGYVQKGGFNNVNNPGLNPYPTTTVTLYGPNPIPTLLGNDEGTPGDYNNDHPVGPLANLGAVAGSWLSNLTVTFSSSSSSTVTNTKVAVAANAGTYYYDFAYTYGLPALNSLAGDGSAIAGNAYVTCTTCHNQHVQNVFKGAPKGAPTGSPAAGLVTTAKIFYMNGPYNPGAPYDPTHEPSTMRFCQQCHFSMSSESYGATNIGTSF